MDAWAIQLEQLAIAIYESFARYKGHFTLTDPDAVKTPWHLLQPEDRTTWRGRAQDILREHKK